jgi:predicted transcriptional regulator
MQTTVKIDTKLRDRIARLAEQREVSMGAVIAAAIEREERAERFAAIDAAYTRLEADPDEWSSYRAEQTEWEATLADGPGDGPADEGTR